MESSVSKPDQWSVKEIGQAFDEKGVGANYVEIPRFQRSLVWSEDQRRMLVDSLYRGFPIGAILGYQTGDKKGPRNVIQIVDGLQRSSAISEYLKQPLYFAPVDRIFSTEFITQISKTIGLGTDSDSESRIFMALEIWMREVKIAKLGASFNATSLIASLSKTLEVEKENFAALEAATSEELGSVIERVKDVESVSIPVVLYSGDVGNIATIFERVNNQGTQLSKYEILASSWVTSQTRITNKRIREAILARYQVLKDRGYHIDGLPEGAALKTDEYNLYEYLFGLGKVLSDDYPSLFGDSGDSDESTPTGFVLVTTLMGLRLSKMKDLVTVIRRSAADPNAPIDLAALESAIFASVKAISGALTPLLTLKMHKKEQGTLIAHSQNQVISLISAHLVNHFDTDSWSAKPGNAGSSIVKAAASHYLLDIVARRWRGSGDSRLYEMTWQEDSAKPSSYYTKPVDRLVLTDALKQWHDEQLTKKQKERANVSLAAQAVLMFLYASLVAVFDNKAVDFELEHIYPVAMISERIEKLKDEEGWPISALGNLTLLPKDLNRIKGKHALGDYLPGLEASGDITATELEKIQKYLLWPDYAEVTQASLADRDFYIEFCRTRMGIISQSIADNLGL